jgi:hypothetical protein
MTLNSLEVTKCCKNLFILFSFFCLQNFLIFTLFLFLELFVDEPAMVLQYDKPQLPTYLNSAHCSHLLSTATHKLQECHWTMCMSNSCDVYLDKSSIRLSLACVAITIKTK